METLQKNNATKVINDGRILSWIYYGHKHHTSNVPEYWDDEKGLVYK